MLKMSTEFAYRIPREDHLDIKRCFQFYFQWYFVCHEFLNETQIEGAGPYTTHKCIYNSSDVYSVGVRGKVYYFLGMS